jgi:hypothetical protein
MFGTKEQVWRALLPQTNPLQRTSRQYAQDNRLRIVLQPGHSPLLAFRPSGGDPNLMQSTSKNVLVEAFSDQILQILFEVENVGKMPVHGMLVCSNYPEQGV